MDELGEIIEKRIELARNEGKMTTLSEITALLCEAIKQGMSLNTFGEVFVSKFCQPTMKNTVRIISRLADIPVGGNGKLN